MAKKSDLEFSAGIVMTVLIENKSKSKTFFTTEAQRTQRKALILLTAP